MIFSLDVRRAHKGDCMLLHFGTKQNPGLMVIDGGPAEVYVPQLKRRLLEIRKNRQLESQQPLPVDVLMVSHVDDDHIRGILDLTRELRAAAGAPLVQVQSLWHNSFDDIIGNDPAELTASVTAQFGAASVNGGSLPAGAGSDLLPGGTEEEQEIAESALLVLASVAQGHTLRGDAETLGWTLNAEHDGKLIVAAKDPVDLGNGLKLTVAGPMLEALKELQKKHNEWLEERKRKKKKSNEAALAAYVDESVANLSSIVVLAECEGKRVLLTGDARGDKVLEGLEETGLLAKGRTLHVDLLKVPHHGSSNNLDDDFFERITADHYVFSGDGKHGNPERESMEMLLKARGKKPFTIHLTYPVADVDKGRKADWEMEQKKEKARKAKGSEKPVRENWSAAKHALAPVLKKRAKGQKLSIVYKTKPHVIDLKDPLGY